MVAWQNGIAMRHTMMGVFLLPPAAHSPDFLGDEGHDICILLNEAYSILSEATAREAYNLKLEQTLVDYEDDYTGNSLSK